MKFLFLLLTVACMQISARGLGQTIRLHLSEAPIETAFKVITQQTGYRFIYTQEDLQGSQPVSCDLNNVSLTTALDSCFSGQPLRYAIEEKYVVVTRQVIKKLVIADTLIKGHLSNEKGEPLAAVSIQVKGSTVATTSDANGNFSIPSQPGDVLVITGAELQTFNYTITGKNFLSLTLQQRLGELDQVVLMAYGSTTKRLNTGDITKVSGEDIAKQPVSNPLAALQGRVPGLLITQSSGVPGAAFKVQLRGQNSLKQGSEPLFIIDGVPFVTGNESINVLSNATGSDGISPFQFINPSDIESIEVLKDADATAIYGSRGANGVILITTKKGQPGKLKVDFSFYQGTNKATRTMKMMNTQQYISMRREALANDGIIPDLQNAPDILLYDTTAYTDLRKLLIGGTGHSADAELTVSGGTLYSGFTIGGGYHQEANVFPGNQPTRSGNFHLGVNHSLPGNKLVLDATVRYSTSTTQLSAYDLSNYITLPPNMQIFDSTGNLNWNENGTPFWNLSLVNPFAFIKRVYHGSFDNISATGSVDWKINADLHSRISGGFNNVTGKEDQLNPTNSFDPVSGTKPFSSFADSKKKGWIIEPTIEYQKNLSAGTLRFLIGGTLQKNQGQSSYLNASEYSSDLLLDNPGAAGKLSITGTYFQYNYTALYGRLSFNRKQKILLNISGRRDGSSRFGPEKRFSNFGSIGAGWIFSKEKFSQSLHFLSFGKLRMSYGITGNDQIGDYKYLDNWTNTNPTTYQSNPALRPVSLFNPDFAWEKNSKWEAGLDLGFIKDKYLLSISAYQNRSSNQLINYALPAQTGFSSVLENINALIQNKGLETSISGTILKRKQLNWDMTFNLTIARNRLLDFPGLANSSYAKNYFIGHSLSTKPLYVYTGINPMTGIYEFSDADQSGTLDAKDKVSLKGTDPRYYGGIQQMITWKQFSLAFSLEFRKQQGLNYLYTQGFNVPGYLNCNQPLIVLQHWKQPGDQASIEKLTATYGSPAYTAANSFLINSDAVYSDASFIRCKNLSIEWNIPPQWQKKSKIGSCMIYLRVQNLFTITHYKGADPENQSIYKLPPLRTLVAGIHLTL